MNISIEVAKFEPEPTFENTTNEIKDNYLKIIFSTAINVPAIMLIDNNLKLLSMNSIIKVVIFEPEPIFEGTTNEIKANHLKSTTFIDMNVFTITLNTLINPLSLLNI